MILRHPTTRARFYLDSMGKVSLGAGPHLYAGLNCFEPGQEHRAHTHPDQDKMYVVLEGEGEVEVGAEKSAVASGDLVIAPAGVSHGIRNTSSERLIVLVVFAPPPAAK